MAQHLIGIDLGGTNLRCAVIDPERRIRARHEAPTPVKDGYAAVIARMADGVNEVIRQAGLKVEDIAAVGVGAPGPLDGRRGIVIQAPNLPDWKNGPRAELLTQKTGIQTVIENDANAAGWG